MEHDIAPTITPGLGEEPAGRPIPEHRDSLLVTSEAAFLMGLSHRTLEALRLRGGGPPFVKVTSRAVRYRRRDVLEWIEQRIRRSTSDPGPVADTPAAPGQV